MSTVTTTIIPFTKSPSRNNPATFSSDMDTRLSEENSRIVDMNSVGTEINTVTSEINIKADSVSDDKSNTELYKQNAYNYKEEAKGYRDEALAVVIPTEQTYSMVEINNKDKTVRVNSRPASGWGSKVEFTEVETANTIRLQANKYDFNGIVKDLPQTDITCSTAPTVKLETTLSTLNNYIKGEFVVSDVEHVTNGTFSSDTDWIKENGTITISGGTAIFSSSGSSLSLYQTTAPIVIGREYIMTFDIVSISSGGIRPSVGGSTAAREFTTVGTHVSKMVATSNTNVNLITKGTTTATVDNVSIKLVNDKYQAIVDTSATDLLTDESKFKPVPYVSRQDIIIPRYNQTTGNVDFINANNSVSSPDLRYIHDVNDVAENYTNDELMISYGFTKGNENNIYLLSGDDVYLYGSPFLWQRLNVGAYHPWLNERGTNYSAQDGTSNQRGWFDVLVTQNNTYDCFDDNKLPSSFGAARPDSASYTKAYNNQLIVKQAYSNIPSNSLLEESVSNLVSGMYTENVEGLKGFKKLGSFNCNWENYYASSFPYFGGTGTIIRVDGDILDESELDTYLPVNHGYIVDKNGNSHPFRVATYSSGTQLLIQGGDITALFDVGTSYEVYQSFDSNILIKNKQLHTDLIGDFDNYPVGLKTELCRSVYGISPLQINQDGTDVIPDGTSQTFTMTKKIKEFIVQLSSTDDGVTWTEYDGAAWLSTLEGAENSLTSTRSVGEIMLENYIAYNKQTIDNVNTGSLKIYSQAIANNSSNISKGGLLTYSSIKKVSVGDGANGLETKILNNIIQSKTLLDWDFTDEGSTTLSLTLDEKFILCTGNNSTGTSGHVYERNDSHVGGVTSDTTPLNSSVYTDLGYYLTPNHSSITLDTEDSPASKQLFALSKDVNDNAYLDVYSQEMIYNSGVFDGDDEQFSQLFFGTITDDNSNTAVTTHNQIPLGYTIKGN